MEEITIIHQQTVVVLGNEKSFVQFDVVKSCFFCRFFSSFSKSSSGANDGDAQKRFSNAKSISSDQFFNKDSDVRM